MCGVVCEGVEADGAFGVCLQWRPWPGSTPCMPEAHSASSARPHAVAARGGVQNGALRAVVMVAGGLACVCVAIPAVGFLTSVRGVPGPTIADATNPAVALGAVAAVLLVCTAVACVVGRVINAAVGLFVLGCGVALLTMRSGTIFDAGADNDALRWLATETLVWAGVVAGLSAIVFRASGPLPDFAPIEAGGPFAREVFNRDALRGLLSGLAGVAVVWLLMRNDLKGQAVGSCVCAGIAVAMVGRKLLGASQPILLVASPLLFIGLAQVWTALNATGPLDVLVAANALPGWARVMPMDAVAGALIGVPIGLGWSRSTAEE